MFDFHRRFVAAGAAAILLVVTLAGCVPPTADVQPVATSAHPLKLRIVTDDDRSKPSGQQILHFADQVRQLSRGTIVVQPRWHAAGDVPDWDEANARLVTSGRSELGLIPARAWDGLGVTSLRALNAPFLITTTPALNAVVSSPAVKPMLAGLAKASVVGVDLFPEGLRHPFGQDEPLRSARDYKGGLIRTPTSVTDTAMFVALGATTSDDDLSPANRGAESSYLLTPGGIATGNVVFYPKVNVLVAGSHAWRKLTEAQRRVLARAAVQTRDWVVSTFPDDRADATAYCAAGGTIAAASAADVAGLERATSSVVSDLEKDAVTKAAIASIRSLTDSVPSGPPPLVSCHGVKR
jgi:TRAP-type C4-dicarboxylate transport system substrate-binding protein